jgi:iron complex outermembrane receptor protein
VISLAKDHFLRVGYNRAFRTPTILDAYINIQTYAAYGNHAGFVIKDMNGNVTANIPALQPEQNNTIELGYKGSIKRRLFIDLVGYYSFYDNFISPLTSVANPAKGTFAFLADGKTPTFAGTMVQGALLTYSNFGKAQVAGASGGFDAWLWRDKLLFTGSASYIHLVNFTVSNAAQKELPLNVPEWNARFSLQLQDAGFRGMFVRFQGRVQEHYQFESGFWNSTKPTFATALPNGELPNRFVGDLVAGVHFNNGVTVSGTIFDLFNDHGIDVLGAPPSGIVGFVQLAYTYSGLDY